MPDSVFTIRSKEASIVKQINRVLKNKNQKKFLKNLW